jgi:hypothetical protein
MADPSVDSSIPRVNIIVIDNARDFFTMSSLFIFFLLGHGAEHGPPRGGVVPGGERAADCKIANTRRAAGP